MKSDHRSKFSNLSNCLNWKIYCDDHSSLHLQPQYKYELFHIYFTTDYFVSYYTAQNSVQQAVSVAALMHLRALHGMTLFRPSISLTDVFAFSKQRAIQLLFVLENLPR